jgi:hypothetical protein
MDLLDRDALRAHGPWSPIALPRPAGLGVAGDLDVDLE